MLATVLSVTAPAEIRQKDEPAFQKITPGSLLAAGAILRTGAGGDLKVALLPNTLVALSPETEVQIDELTLAKDGDETGNGIRARVAAMRLQRGSIHVAFEAIDAAKTALRVRTPYGIVTASSDCAFFLEVDDVRARVICVQGAVNTRIGQAAISIEAGYFQEFPSNQLAPQPAESDAQAQDETVATIAAAGELQNLATARRTANNAFR